MATIMKYNTPEGITRWRVRWWEDEKQKSKTFDRQKLAKDYQVKIENSERDGSYVSPSKIRVGTYLDAWIDKHQHKINPSTAKRYKGIIRRMSAEIGAKYIQQLTPGQIQDMYTNLSRKLSGTTLLQMHRVLSRAFKDAIRNRLIDKNPCDYIDTPKRNKYQANIVQPDEVSEFLKQYEGHLAYPAVCIALFCGLRLSEILALRWEDIDFKKGLLTVNHSIYWQQDEYMLLPPKSKQKRVVPLTTGVIDILKNLKQEKQRNMELLWNEYHRSEFIITNPDGSLVKPYNLSRQHKNHIAKTKFNNIRFHDLRHTAASLMLMEGEELKTVSNILGHSTIAITADIYIHIVEAQKRTALNRLEKYMTSN